MADGQKKRGQDKDPISPEVHTFKTSGNSAAQKRKDVQEALAEQILLRRRPLSISIDGGYPTARLKLRVAGIGLLRSIDRDYAASVVQEHAADNQINAIVNVDKSITLRGISLHYSPGLARSLRSKPAGTIPCGR
ncbi:hypothetical protein T190_28865 [Sinorhizobium meliloti CCBAU 01290]|nr:hypothetical protein T190_28865 [Sinorhizobium meliloti CCBAU 01290]